MVSLAVFANEGIYRIHSFLDLVVELYDSSIIHPQPFTII